MAAKLAVRKPSQGISRREFRIKLYCLAEKYDGLWTLERLESHVAEHWRLPGITDAPAGIFDMADIALEKIEQLFLYSFAAHKRIKVLEAMLKIGGNN